MIKTKKGKNGRHHLYAGKMTNDKDYHASRFSSLWKKWLPKWQTSQIQSTDWKTQGLCISTVARICNTDSSLACQLETAVSAIAKADEANFYIYPQESLHLSLLGCTPRKSDWTSEKVAKASLQIASVVKTTLVNSDSLEFRIGQPNVCGPALFAEVYPRTDGWSQMREKLGNALLEKGFEPIIYKDTRPIHLNLGRVYPGSATKKLAAAIQRSRDTSTSKTIHIKDIELILTDFVLSPALTKNLMTFRLG